MRSQKPLRWSHRERNPKTWISTKIREAICLAWKQVDKHTKETIAAFKEAWFDNTGTAQPFGKIEYSDTAVPYLRFLTRVDETKLKESVVERPSAPADCNEVQDNIGCRELALKKGKQRAIEAMDVDTINDDTQEVNVTVISDDNEVGTPPYPALGEAGPSCSRPTAHAQTSIPPRP